MDPIGRFFLCACCHRQTVICSSCVPVTMAISIVRLRVRNRFVSPAYVKPADGINIANTAVLTMRDVWSDIAPNQQRE